MKPFKNSGSSRRHGGQALIELLLVSTGMLFLLYLVMDLTLIFVDHQNILTLAQEGAKTVCIDCGSLSTFTERQTCVTNAITDLNNAGARFFPDFGINGTVRGHFAEYVPATETVPEGMSFVEDTTDTGDRPKRVFFSLPKWIIYAAGGGAGPVVYNVGTEKIFAVVEGYYKRPGHTPLQGLLNLAMPQDYYAIAIY